MGIAFAGNLFTLFLFYEMLTLVDLSAGRRTRRPRKRDPGWPHLSRPAAGHLHRAVAAGDCRHLAVGRHHRLHARRHPGRQGSDAPALGVLLALYVFGIGKAALMPLHRWLPAAMVAPTPVSARCCTRSRSSRPACSRSSRSSIYVFGIDALARAASATG